MFQQLPETRKAIVLPRSLAADRGRKKKRQKNPDS
jgi:hypothetical protein